MPKENRVVSKIDLIPSKIYSENRKEYRKKLVQFKKDRRIPLGPYATFYFESYETMLGQIQEMLYIEKGGDEQLKDELTAYNPLIPKGNELVATLMFEIDDPNVRKDFLNGVGGIEEKVYLLVGNEKIIASPEKDLDRTSSDGKASSVQFIHFKFNKDQIQNFKDKNIEVTLGIDHKSYNHITKISDLTKASLAKDFN